MSICIRAALPGDAPLIATLIRELAEYEKLLHECQVTPEAIRTSLFGGKPQAECVIAERNGIAVGFALFFHNYSTFLAKPGLYLEDLFVRPAARKHGVGKALLAHLAKLAVTRGCGRFEWSVLDWNAPAIAFYESLGAKAQNEWTIYRVSGDALPRLAAQALG
jgi:GNAT superfamily N-acetyltransferase